MKRFVYFASILFILMSSCAPTAEPDGIGATATNSEFQSVTSTATVLPTATKRPSATPEIPTASITPMSVAPVSVSPLALNEFNAGTEMKRLNIIGTGKAHDIKFSPDGKRFAVATGRGIYLYDGTTFEQNGFIDVNDSVTAIAFSPDGNVLAVAVDGKASLWNVLSGRQILSLDGGLVSISNLAYGKGGYVAGVGSDYEGYGSAQLAMIMWNVKTGSQIFMQRDIWYLTQALEFTPDGERLFFGGQQGLTAVDSKTGEIVEINNSMKVRAPYNLMFNNDGSKFFVTSMEDTNSNLSFDMNSQTRSTFSFCGAYLANAGQFGACMLDQKIVVFDSITGQEIKSVDTNVEAPSYSYVLLALSPDGRFLAYNEEDVVHVVSVEDNKIIKNLEYPGFSTVGTGLIFLDGRERYLAAVEYPIGQISLIDLLTAERLRTLKMDCCEISGFAFAPDRQTVAVMGDHILQILNVSSEEVIYETKFQKDFSGPIVFSPDGVKVFLTPTRENFIVQFDLKTREIVKIQGFPYSYGSGNMLAPDNFHFDTQGNLIVFEFENATNGYYPLFRDIATNEKIVIPYNTIADSQFLETFALSHDDEYLVFGNAAGIFVWDVRTLTQRFYLNKHERRGGDGWIGSIRSLMFSPQSNLLASVGWDGTTRLWNAAFGIELRILNVCCSASFTPDGRYFVTAGDGVMRVWGIP